MRPFDGLSRASGGSARRGLGLNPNRALRDGSETIPVRIRDSPTLSETLVSYGGNEEKHGFPDDVSRLGFRPHNPLVVCSNHTGPSDF